MPETYPAIAQLIEAGHLQWVPGHAAHTQAFLDKAREYLEAAERLLPHHPDFAFLSAFSAVRSALLGVLAHHDLALTDSARDRSDQANDDAIAAAVAELVGGGRFPGCHELRVAYGVREYGTDSPRSVTDADAERWVSVAAGIVDAAAEELASG